MKRRGRTTLNDRVAALGEAAGLTAGRGDDDVVAEAIRVVRQADRRLAFSGDVTVVALGGATGSGKSSLFNAVSGTQLAESGVKRPTTSRAMAASWTDASPDALLDWLEVPTRHLITGGEARFTGLVLLDLPDHDSTEMSHRLEVDRLVKLVDGLIWVVDPQKYADNALHERYLVPYRDYADVMLIVLNQADRLTVPQLESALRDLRALLESEGLGKAKVLAVSALTGQGIDDLRRQLADMVKHKKLAAERLSADVTRAAHALDTDLGQGSQAEIPAAREHDLDEALAAAAGVPRVKEAVLMATRRRGSLATGWPLVSWINKFKPDPLRRLHLDRFVAPKAGKPDQNALEPTTVQRTGLQVAGGVQQARVDSALRAIADDASAGLPTGWSEAVRRASLLHRDTLADDLDRAVASTDLGMAKPQGWWKLFRALQWLLIAVVLFGALWLTAGMVFVYLQLPPPVIYRWRGIPLSTILLVGGLIVGLLLGLIGRAGVELSARHRAEQAESRLTKAIGEVAQARVIDPVNAELSRYSKARRLLDSVL